MNTQTHTNTNAYPQTDGQNKNITLTQLNYASKNGSTVETGQKIYHRQSIYRRRTERAYQEQWEEKVAPRDIDKEESAKQGKKNTIKIYI